MFRGPIGCAETSVRNYQRPLHNILEARRPQLHRGGSQESRNAGRCLEMPYRLKAYTTRRPMT